MRPQDHPRSPIGTPAELASGIPGTEVTRGVARAVVVVFMASIAIVPLSQTASEILAGRRPQVLDVAHAPTTENLSRFERDLERSSRLRTWVQPRFQSLITGTLGFGNVKCVVARDRWLYYEPGLDHVTGAGILDDARLSGYRAKLLDRGSIGRSVDPRPAILSFQEQCARAGIRLIFMLVPDKAMLQPEHLTGRLSGARAPIDNLDLHRFEAELASAGIDVFDPTPAVIEPGEARFLETDTHWRPDWMATVARDLARRIESTGLLAPRSGVFQTRLERRQISRVGDLVDMLELPRTQRIFPPQTVTIETVVTETLRSTDAEVLILGDSFANIYSSAQMGWGASAGLPDRLAHELGRPVDRIVRNDAGAHATREMLAREVSSGSRRLDRLKVIVWEVAMRELTAGDWKPVAMEARAPAAAPSSTGFFVAPRGSTVVVRGVVAAISRAADPGSAPYKDQIVALHLEKLEGVSGAIGGDEAVVYVWAMRDSALTPAARLRAGDSVTLRLRPWIDVEPDYASIMRTELPSDALLLEEPNWGEEISP